ncbi:O-methyltransferase [Bifidobacterium avesanii]|uniref:Methyltransferase n=1 Tax=Bifidobacterium avesanii TaxID=1798157 RepID=A0A7K3THQ1_9BIFI|nr:class I SAM-dependent methyltransferase [Bifidobacterium avesanii]KAB8292842.1 methyltransferase [Bifidobacterium avesanii]NEG78446.1 methyltransferase [Bifidobacterium avesanii]
MNKTSYTNLAKAWELAEDTAFARQSDRLHALRLNAEETGFPQGSASQADFLRMLVRLTGARSIIMVGTCNAVETYQLVAGLAGGGQLTAVDSSPEGTTLIRRMFAQLDNETDTTLRMVNVAASQFLPRLNASDYDLIVVAGDAGNYAPAYRQAVRLLREGGALVFTDAFAFAGANANGGLLNPADRSDKAVELRTLLDTVAADEEFDTTLAPVGTGLMLSIKR